MMKNNLYPLSELTDIIQTRRRNALKHRETKQLLKSIIQTIIITVLFIVVFLNFFHFRIVDGNNMYPAISDGDLVLGYNESDFKKNDIIYYTYNNESYLGRVVAKAGDKVDISSNGDLIINGTTQTGEIMFPTFKPDSWTGTVIVPEDSLFVLGDFRTQTLDSRNFGCISTNNVEMKIITIIRHRKL